jgi:F-type H+-transporting ATPase subunit beta
MAKGKVTQIIGTVVDIEFPQEELPEIYNAIEINQDGQKIILEAEQHIGNNYVRCLALTPTDGLERGTEALDTGASVQVPVGKPTLGRIFNVFGQPLDTLGEVKSDNYLPIHREPYSPVSANVPEKETTSGWKCSGQEYWKKPRSFSGR